MRPRVAFLRKGFLRFGGRAGKRDVKGKTRSPLKEIGRDGSDVDPQ